MPKKKRNIGGFLKKLGLGGLSIAAELDPTGIAKKVASRIPGLAELIDDNTLTDQEAYQQAIKANPNLMLELRAIEAEEFKAKVDALMKYESLETERVRLDVEDVKDARNMRIQTDSKYTERLTTGTAAAVFLMVGLLFFFDIPEGNIQLINIAFGSLLTVFVGCYRFFTGSSTGSKSKDSTMDKLLSGGTGNGATYFKPSGHV